MLNLATGAEVEVDGRPHILTTRDARGHAIYGPYEQLTPGRYAVEFRIAPVNGQRFGSDFVCAVADVAIRSGAVIVASQNILMSSLRDGAATFTLHFTLEATETVEFRVGVNGKAPLLIDDHRVVVRVPDWTTEDSAAALIEAARYPEPAEGTAPALFVEQQDRLRQMHRDGVGIRIVGQDVVLSVDGISFLVRSADDFMFVHEVLLRNAYNVLTDTDVVMVDIGMNIGLASLLFASKARVRAVHAFEPFQTTFNRALSNIAINPALADKITAYNVGLADRDEDVTVPVMPEGASGSMSIRAVDGGVPIDIRIRDAAGALAPILHAAREAGQRVIVKVDCEGSEFDIFASLERSGLLLGIHAFMVEWHRMFPDKSQADLIDPLIRAGFTIFDQSPRTGNGFFYAVRGG